MRDQATKYLAILAIAAAGVPLVMCGSDVTSPPPTTPMPADCNEAALARALADADAGVDGEQVRRQLETAIVRCAEPDAQAGKPELIGRVNADLARAGAEVADGVISGSHYLDLVADRTGKFAIYRSDPGYREAYARGDKDGDLVPDDRDRCPDTPPFTATDRDGCPLPSTDPACPSALVKCGDTTKGRVDEPTVRNAFDRTTLMFDPHCDAAQPRTPSPLAWGRGTQNAAWGFNLMTTKVPATGLAPGCELFYEVEVRFASPGKADLAPILYTNVLFRASEDLHPGDPHLAVFGVPVQNPPAGARADLVTGFSNYHDVTWRVRAVTGNQVPSPWSAPRTQGPAAAGVF